MKHFENNNLDIQNISTLRETVKSFIFTEKELFEIFGKKGMKLPVNLHLRNLNLNRMN